MVKRKKKSWWAVKDRNGAWLMLLNTPWLFADEARARAVLLFGAGQKIKKVKLVEVK